jgi:hypothetical protein
VPRIFAFPAPAPSSGLEQVDEFLRRVRRDDALIPADRRAPRTVAEMRRRLAVMGSDEDDLNEDLDRDYSQRELDEILGEGLLMTGGLR